MMMIVLIYLLLLFDQSKYERQHIGHWQHTLKTPYRPPFYSMIIKPELICTLGQETPGLRR